MLKYPILVHYLQYQKAIGGEFFTSPANQFSTGCGSIKTNENLSVYAANPGAAIQDHVQEMPFAFYHRFNYKK